MKGIILFRQLISLEVGSYGMFTVMLHGKIIMKNYFSTYALGLKAGVQKCLLVAILLS